MTCFLQHNYSWHHWKHRQRKSLKLAFPPPAKHIFNDMTAVTEKLIPLLCLQLRRKRVQVVTRR